MIEPAKRNQERTPVAKPQSGLAKSGWLPLCRRWLVGHRSLHLRLASRTYFHSHSLMSMFLLVSSISNSKRTAILFSGANFGEAAM